MTGKRDTTKDSISILRDAARGQKIIEACEEKSLWVQTFYPGKYQFGMLQIPSARQLKELKKESNNLKKMLAESFLKDRGLVIGNAKMQARDRSGS